MQPLRPPQLKPGLPCHLDLTEFQALGRVEEIRGDIFKPNPLPTVEPDFGTLQIQSIQTTLLKHLDLAVNGKLCGKVSKNGVSIKM